MVSTWPRMRTKLPRGSEPAVLVDDALDVACDRAEVAVLHGAIDIDRAADVVVRDDGHLGAARDVATSARISGLRGAGGGDGDVLQILQRLDVVLRGLGDHVVVDAVLRVQEEHAA